MAQAMWVNEAAERSAWYSIAGSHNPAVDMR
jgi:hypothetical protein